MISRTLRNKVDIIGEYIVVNHLDVLTLTGVMVAGLYIPQGVELLLERTGLISREQF